MAPFLHVPHPHIVRRAVHPPLTTVEHLDRSTPASRFNACLAVGVTKAVGSMWCAYAFAVLTLFGLPAALNGGVGPVVQWVAQTFLQLVLLSVIMVGQNVQAKAADERARMTYCDVEAILHELAQVQAHLVEQDTVMTPPGFHRMVRQQEATLVQPAVPDLRRGPVR